MNVVVDVVAAAACLYAVRRVRAPRFVAVVQVELIVLSRRAAASG